MNKTINIITPFYYPIINGLSHVVQQNVEALLELEYDVNVFTSLNSTPFSSENVFCFDLKGNGSLLNPIKGDIVNYLNSIIINSVNADILIIHGWHSSFTNIILENTTNFSSKICLYSHGTGFSSNDGFLKSILRRLNYFGQKSKIKIYIDKLDHIIFITTNTKHPRCYDLLNYKKESKSFIFNSPPERNCNQKGTLNFNNLEYFINTDNTKRTLFCLSNYEEIKNHSYLFKLANKYKFKLICVGSKNTKYLNKLKNELVRLNISDNVLLLVNQSDDVIEWLFENTDFFLFASRNDFSPLVLLETSKYKLPFISFETADNNRPGGFFCKNNCEYENTLKALLKMNKLDLEKIGLEGFNYYLTTHTKEKYVKSLNQFLTKIQS